MTVRTIRTTEDLDSLAFWENGLLPVVAQDADSRAVLMVAFANREALEKTLETGQMHYWSRSRQELWHKGATSGNTQELVSLHGDCDADTLLALVRPDGPACHTGEVTCFGELAPAGASSPPPGSGTPGASPDQGLRHDEEDRSEAVLPGLWTVLRRRARERPEGSYTVRLLDDENLRLKKLGEETAELIVALSRGEEERISREGADVVYHLLAALLASGVSLDDLLDELETRRR